MSSLVRFERVVGDVVRDCTGRKLGHLHEARTRQEGADLVVVDYLVGPAGLLERFSLERFGRELAGLFGFAGAPSGYVVPWHRMDFSPAGNPRCTCRAEELQSFSGEPPGERGKSSA
jgi:hypothetical protein